MFSKTVYEMFYFYHIWTPVCSLKFKIFSIVLSCINFNPLKTGTTATTRTVRAICWTGKCSVLKFKTFWNVLNVNFKQGVAQFWRRRSFLCFLWWSPGFFPIWRSQSPSPPPPPPSSSDENTFIGGLLLSGGTSLPMWWIGARCGASQLCEETARLLFFRPPSIVKRMLGYHDGGFNGGRLTRTGYLELDYNILQVKVMF